MRKKKSQLNERNRTGFLCYFGVLQAARNYSIIITSQSYREKMDGRRRETDSDAIFLPHALPADRISGTSSCFFS